MKCQIKNRKTKTKSQKYIYKHCRKTYTPVQKERTYGEKIVDCAIELYIEQNSGRTVGRLLKIIKNMCLNWIHKRAKIIVPNNKSHEKVETLEMDELLSFKERKTPIYIITLINN